MTSPVARPLQRVDTALKLLGSVRTSGHFELLPTSPFRPDRQAVKVEARVRGARIPIVVKSALANAGQLEAMQREHHVAASLSSAAERMVDRGALPRNPLARPLHSEVVVNNGFAFSVSSWLPEHQAVRPEQWGETIALYHRVASSEMGQQLMHEYRATNTFVQFDPRRFAESVAQPEHPLAHHRDLVRSFVAELGRAIETSLEMDPDPVLTHRDLHLLNARNTAAGPVVFDFEEAAWGSRSDDFAWTYLLTRRFGFPPSILESVQRGYRSVDAERCPSAAQITSAGRVRELIFLGFSMQNALQSPAHLAEFARELPVLDDAGVDTEPWQLLFNRKVVERQFAP